MSTKPLLLIAETEDEALEFWSETASCDVLDCRGQQPLETLASLTQATFFGETAERIFITGLEPIGARPAHQIVEAALAACKSGSFALAFYLSQVNSPKQQKKFEKVLVEQCTKRQIKPPTLAELSRQVVTWAKERQVLLKKELAELLVERIGNNPRVLRLEIDKMALGGEPTAADILAIASLRRYDIYPMVRSILEGKKLEVLRQIQQMELSEDMFTIANAFVYELARLYMVKLLGTRADFPTAGISAYSVPLYKSCTDKLSHAACEALMDEAATLDYTLKTTSIGYEQIYLLVERIEYLTRNTSA